MSKLLFTITNEQGEVYVGPSVIWRSDGPGRRVFVEDDEGDAERGYRRRLMLKIVLEDMGEEREFGPFAHLRFHDGWVIADQDQDDRINTGKFIIFRDGMTGKWVDDADGSAWRELFVQEWNG